MSTRPTRRRAAGAGACSSSRTTDHSAAQVSDAQLVNLLGDQDSLRLVVLNSCEGARTSVVDPFAGIATSIVELGIPAVVAMQFEISDKAAITFAEELYQSLIARQDPIDVAVAEARKAVFTEVNETEWATPVLFLRNEDGRLFDFAPVVARRARQGPRRPPRPIRPPSMTASRRRPPYRAARGGRGRRSRHGDGWRTAATGGRPPAAGAAARGHRPGGRADPAAGGAHHDRRRGTGAPRRPPPSGTPATWISPTGPRPMAQPQAKRASSASRPWMIGVIAVVVVVLLLGGLSAAGLFGTAQETPGPSNCDRTSSATDRSNWTDVHATGSADTTTHGYPVVPGTKDEWVGPRSKSNKLAVAGGASSSVTERQHAASPRPGGGQTVPAGVATDLPRRLRLRSGLGPAAQCHRLRALPERWLADQVRRARHRAASRWGGRPGHLGQGSGVEGRRPPGRVITHRPGGATAISCSRGPGLPTRPGCVEDIVLATFSKRIGDYIVPIDHPAVVSDEWSEIRKISVDPTNDQRILVTGRNMKSPGKEFGVWVVDLGGDRALLPGSENATYAIVGTNDAVVAIERGNQDGWGPALLAWPRGRTGQPDRIPADDIIAKMPDGSGSAVPNRSSSRGSPLRPLATLGMRSSPPRGTPTSRGPSRRS